MAENAALTITINDKGTVATGPGGGRTSDAGGGSPMPTIHRGGRGPGTSLPNTSNASGTFAKTLERNIGNLFGRTAGQAVGSVASMGQRMATFGGGALGTAAGAGIGAMLGTVTIANAVGSWASNQAHERANVLAPYSAAISQVRGQNAVATVQQRVDLANKFGDTFAASEKARGKAERAAERVKTQWDAWWARNVGTPYDNLKASMLNDLADHGVGGLLRGDDRKARIQGAFDDKPTEAQREAQQLSQNMKTAVGIWRDVLKSLKVQEAHMTKQQRDAGAVKAFVDAPDPPLPAGAVGMGGERGDVQIDRPIPRIVLP